MSKILKVTLVFAYCALLFQFMRTLMNRNETIIDLNYVLRTPGSLKKMNREIKKFGKNGSAKVMTFEKPIRLKTDLKYILKYTTAYSHYSSSIYRNGQEAFVNYNCTYFNCFMTNDKSLITDIRFFDAILFDVENTWDHHPHMRSSHQKYIFTASESAQYYPICPSFFENYYNWTWSYKLDSDIRWSYITIVDKQGKVVGPKINMSWISPMEPISDKVKKKLSTKTKSAAWFVSNCLALSYRENTTKNIQTALSKYGLAVDIFGACGNMTCPRDRQEDCLNVLEEDYYFYFAFENSICEDYVTEKILHPLQHYAVPIVLGGADYSR